MKKCRIKCAAVLLALALPFALASCKGVELADLPTEGAPVSQTASLPESKAESVPQAEAASQAEISSGEAAPTVSGEAAEPPASSEAVPSQAAGSEIKTPPELPSSSEPLDLTEPGTVPSVENAINQANINAKAAEAPEPAAPVEPTPVKQEEPAPEVREAVTNDEMKAVWLSFLEFQGFAGSNEDAFTSKIEGIFDTIAGKGLNTVIVQVRPHGDSFYDSAYYPWSKCISGTMGVGVSYDPVEIMVREAHARGLSIHAWINPYRTMTEKEFATVDASYPVKAWHDASNRGEYMVYNQSDGRWWLKPGNSEVQQLIVDGAAEIVSRYDVDGIHLDDYFYCASPASYGDTAEQAKANTTALVQALYQTVKAYNGTVQFGVSPAGSFRMDSNLPESDKNYLSTDLALWCAESGYIDYVMPQIYWEHTHSVQPFTQTLRKWEGLVTSPDVKLYVGLAPYKLSAEETEAQIDEIASDSLAEGYCLFRYDFIHGLDLLR